MTVNSPMTDILPALPDPAPAPVITVIEPEAFAPLGRLGQWLFAEGASLRVVRPWAGEAIPGPAGAGDQVGGGGEGGRQGADAEEDTDPEQDRLASEVVGEASRDDRAEDRPDGRNGDDHALAEGGQRVQRFELLLRA